MKVVKPMKLALLTRVQERLHRPQFHVAAMLGFSLGSPRALVDELALWGAVGSALGAQGVLDEGFAKARGELLVAGNFHAPGGAPLPVSYVRVKLGSVDKRLAIVGDRFWQGTAATAPAPMKTMPLDWTRAFGSAGYERNPYGKGADPIEMDGVAIHPMPNVERYGAITRSPADRAEPAGFLPMDLTFAQRRARAGTYDKRWLEEHFPGMPPDMDPTFFNVAPEDQWIPGFFRGDEAFMIENMHPDEPRIEGRLPGLAPRCFVAHKTPEGERFLEIALRCDTVWLLPEVGIGVAISHGTLWVAEDDAADIKHLVAACEDPASPRPIEHYQKALARRLDKDKGLIADLSDSDLMPPRESGVAPNIGESDVGQWVKTENITAENLRRGQEKQLKEAQARLVAEGLDPKDYGLAALPETPPEAPTDDLDAMAAHIEAQLDRVKEETKDLDTKEAEAKQRARELFAEMGEDYDALVEQALKKGAGPPTFSAAAHIEMLTTMTAEAQREGIVLEDVEQQLADPSFRAGLVAQEQGLREMYQRFGHFQPAASVMDREAADRVRVLIQLAKETGESLARRDFTGAILAGMSLAGLDFSDAFLESADLSGCDLSGANLAGAVLAKANLAGANLLGARLAGANLGGAVLTGASLESADLSGAVLSRAELAGARFTAANLTGVDWFEVKPGAVDLSGAVLGQCTLIHGDFRGARFVGSDLSDATLIECAFDRADFSRATLNKTTFVGCKGEDVLFRGASLKQVIMVHGSAFPRADFSDADMQKANLRGAVVSGARFDRAELQGADLSECDASHASFERAVIKGGMLIRTNLDEASWDPLESTCRHASLSIL